MRHLFLKIIFYLSAFLCLLRISAADAQEHSALAVQEQVTNLTVDLQRIAEDALRENERLGAENNALTLEYKRQQGRVQEFSGKIRETQRFIEDQQDLEKFRLEEKNAQRQCEDLRGHIGILENETASLRLELDALSRENAQRQRQVDSLKAQRQSLVEYQSKNFQFRDHERLNTLSDQRQAWQGRFDILKARQNFLAQRIRSAQKGLALAQLPGNSVMDLGRYRQLLRLLYLNGSRARPRCLGDCLKASKERYVFQGIGARDIHKSLKDLEVFSTRVSAHPAVPDPDLQDVERNKYRDLLHEHLQWASEQASRIFKEYQDTVEDVIFLKQSAEDLSVKVQARDVESKKLFAQLKSLDTYHQEALSSLQQAQTADVQQRQQQAKQKQQDVLDQGLRIKRLQSLQEDIDHYDDRTKKILLAQEQRLQKVLSDLRTQQQVLMGKISNLQSKIARSQEEKKILEDVLESGKPLQDDQKMKARTATSQSVTTSSSRKPEWKMPRILQE